MKIAGEEACFELAKSRIFFSQKTKKYNLIFLVVWGFYVNINGVRQSKYAFTLLSLTPNCTFEVVLLPLKSYILTSYRFT